MKILLLLINIILFTSCKGQEVYEKSIFLGEYNDKNEIKVFINDSIKFVKKESLSQTNQYSAKNFIKTIDSLDLYFIAEGDEPFWKLRLNLNKITIFKYDSGKEEIFDSKIYIDEQSGFNIMFKSTDNKVFGLIRRVDYKLNGENSCSLGLSDNFLIYETFVTVNKKVYKGCAMVDKIE